MVEETTAPTSEEKAEAPASEVEAAKAEGAAESTETKEDSIEATESKEGQNAESSAPKVPSKPKELEEDGPSDARLKITEQVKCHVEDTTLNVMPALGGKLMMSLGDGGFQYLLAGARANIGITKGRYAFEVSIAELKNPSEPAGAKAQAPRPRNLVRVGFATAESPLLLTDGVQNCFFDNEGGFTQNKQRTKATKGFSHSSVVAVVLNLEEGSPNAYTLSLFRDGERVSEPQALPESLKGKALFPAVTYRNVSLRISFGPELLKPLPFKCRTVQDAAQEDCAIKEALPFKDGKAEVRCPVGLPDQATFDWLDQFLAKNKGYVEISDRMIVDWAAKSGVRRQKPTKSSNDKPDAEFGLPLMDDLSVNRAIIAATAALKRNYVIMEIKSNLLEEDRKKMLNRFPSFSFRKVADIVMGEPSDEYKTWIQQAILQDKKKKEEAEAARRKAEDARKKAEDDKKKTAEAAKKPKVAKEGEAEGAKEAEGKEEEKEEMPVEVELTEDEKKLWFRKRITPDITEKELSSSFAEFTLPTKEEGFDDISIVWHDEAKCKEYLAAWIAEKKRCVKVEGLEPSEWFKSKFADWTKLLTSWKKAQTEWKDPAKRKALQQKKKEEKKDGEDGEESKMEINAEDVDVFSVEDVTDIGNGEPLFAHFVYEDWVLLTLRFELNLLVHAFRHDLDDPERQTFHENHLTFYYNKYYRKQLNIKLYGVNKLAELMDIVKDTMTINAQNSTIEPQLSEDTPVDNFIKLTEDHRRDRQRRLDAGDETALLKFSRPAAAPPRQPAQPTPQSRPASSYGSRSSAPAAPSRSYYSGTAPASRSAYTSGGSGGSYASQKRPYSSAPAAYPPAKRAAYGSSYGGGGGGGGSAYGYSAYGRR